MCIGVRAVHRQALERKLEELAGALRGRGVELDVAAVGAGDYVLFISTCGGQPPASGAWASILRRQLAAALADVAMGALTQRWLTRRVAQEARRRGLFLSPAMRPRAINLARQLLEPPRPEAAGAPPALLAAAAQPASSSHAGMAAATVEGPPALAPAARGTSLVPASLYRWQARIGGLLLELLSGDGRARAGLAGDGADDRPSGQPEGLRPLVLEGVVRFRVKEYLRALDRAAAAAVVELVSEREEQRMLAPWRSLWLGPPPRIYEVHVVKEQGGGYRLLDRWGGPASGRLGAEAATSVATEDALVSQLTRLGPRRIVLHADDELVQLAVRGAFPGRVHTCRGCPRCSRARPTTPQQPG